MLMKGPLLELSLRGILAKNISQNLSQTAMNLQRIHFKILAKSCTFIFKVFLLCRVRATTEKVAEKESILARER